MKLKITFDGIPPSMNHAYRRRGHTHGMYMTQSAKDFKEYASLVAKIAMRESRWTMLPKDENFYLMEIHFHFKNRRHPDPNNLLKILIDSLEGIVFENDKNIDVFTKSAVDGKNKTIVIFSK